MLKHELVRRVLENCPEARNSDMELIIQVWQSQGFGASETQLKKLRNDLMSPETITRIRRKLRETGIVHGSQDIEEARYKKFVEVRGNSSLDNLELVL